MTPTPVFHYVLSNKKFPQSSNKIGRTKFIEFLNEPLIQFVDPDPGDQLITDPDPI